MREDWDEYFLDIAQVVSKHSTCLRRQVGAVLVIDRHIIATGYNGSPSNTDHCSKVGCIRQELGIPSGERHELCRGVHAEQNAIIQCALHGISPKGATLYCTHTPCIICAKMLINCGVRRIVCRSLYNDKEAMKLLSKAYISIEGLCTLKECFNGNS